MKLLWLLIVLSVAGHCRAIENRDLYDVVAQGSVTLPRADDESVQVQLQSPIHFYTEKYDSIYVSSQVSPSCQLDTTHKVCGHYEKIRDIFRTPKSEGEFEGDRGIITFVLVCYRHYLKMFSIVKSGVLHAVVIQK